MATRNQQPGKSESGMTRSLPTSLSSSFTPSSSGIDRTVIRRLLALTPAERARLAVDEARNLRAFEERVRGPRR